MSTLERLKGDRSEQEEERESKRSLLLWLLWALLVFLILFGCGQIATWMSTADIDVPVQSVLQADYGVWESGLRFGPVSPSILDDIAQDANLQVSILRRFGQGCFLPRRRRWRIPPRPLKLQQSH